LRQLGHCHRTLPRKPPTSLLRWKQKPRTKSRADPERRFNRPRGGHGPRWSPRASGDPSNQDSGCVVIHPMRRTTKLLRSPAPWRAALDEGTWWPRGKARRQRPRSDEGEESDGGEPRDQILFSERPFERRVDGIERAIRRQAGGSKVRAKNLDGRTANVRHRASSRRSRHSLLFR
jgi:hypothetical protein